MKTLTSLAVVLLLASLMPVEALEIRRIEEANLAGDLSTLLALREEADAEPYASAYLEYCIGVLASVAGDRQQAKTALKASAGILREQVKDNPAATESQALLANAYGMQIGLAPLKGVTLGPKANRAIRAALDNEPRNPRALMIQGISRYHTPSMFGGSKDGALGWFDKAIDAYKRGPSGPGWGHAEAYVWRGLTNQELGKSATAIEDFRTALSIEPSYTWARALLDNAAADAASR